MNKFWGQACNIGIIENIFRTFSFNFKSFFLHANPREVSQID